MKILKILGIVVLALILIVLVLGLFAPKDYRVERSITIEAPNDLVFRHVQYWKNWTAWSPWAERDSTIQVTYEGVDGTKGAKYMWQGDPEITGKGEMVNTGVAPNQQIDYHLNFIEPWPSESDGFVKVEEEGEGSKVTWGFYGKAPSFPWNVMMLFMSMEKMIGPDFERGLALLKETVEKEEAAISALVVREESFPAKTFAVVRKRINMSDIKQFYGESYGKIGAVLAKRGMKMAGMPCGLYYEWDEGTGETDLAAAIPVTRSLSVGEIESVRLPAGRALVVDYYGPYEGVGVAHMAIDRYIAQKGLEFKPPVIEQYVTDPGTEPDPNKWLTKVYYLID